MKIRTLARAGVPLTRIKDLLTADPDQFAAAVADIDRALQDRADAIRDTRLRLAQLAAADEAFVPSEVVGYLDRLRELGVSGRAIQMERDGWILMHSASPIHAAGWIAEKLTAINEREFTTIYLEYDAAFEWSPDDPRLPALAERTQRWLANRSPRPTDPDLNVPDPTIVQLAATLTGPTSPAWDRLNELAQQQPTDRRTGSGDRSRTMHPDQGGNITTPRSDHQPSVAPGPEPGDEPVLTGYLDLLETSTFDGRNQELVSRPTLRTWPVG